MRAARGRASKDYMHIDTTGAVRRPKNTYQTYPYAALGHKADRNAPVTNGATGLLTRDHLRRLVAAMVD